MRIRKERLLPVAALVAAIALGPTAFGQKIDPRVRERAQSEAAVAVFIVLEHQPQGEIFQRAESANALYREVAESRQAREAADAVVLRTRQQAFQDIRQAVGAEQDALEGRLRGLGATRISRYLGINMLAAEIPAPAIVALEADPAIARVFAVEKQYAQLANSVPSLGAPAFWIAGFTGQGESVGILDTGVRTNHPAFAGVSIVSQVFLANGSTDPCFVDDAGSAQDQFGHGTHVAGIVASQGSAGWTNYQGVAKGIGTLYNLKIGYVVRASTSCNPAGAVSDQRDVVAALDWAVANTSLKIFNYSYGSPTSVDDDGFSQSIDQYIDNYGLTITIAAGNGGEQGYGVSSPGIAYNGITVGNENNSSSSHGPTTGGRYKPDLAAPGTNIYSTSYAWDADPGTEDDFVSMTGTSMAAPHIAGSVALLGSAGVTDPLAAKAVLINTAANYGVWSNAPGWGITNLNTALAQLNYASGSLGAGSQQYYKVSLTGAFQASVTWNRHVSGGTSYFNNVALHLYRGDTGEEIASAPASIQNVQQLSATYTGDAVLGVEMVSAPLAGVTSEPYGVAFSVPATPITRTSIGVSCSLPSSILSGSEFNITCSVSDTGSFAASGLVGQIALPAGFSGPTQMPFSDVEPGAVSPPVTNVLTAPTAAGAYAIRVEVPIFFGTTATGSYTAVVEPSLPAPRLISPGNGASGVSLTPALSWSTSVGAVSYDVYFGSSMPPVLVASTTGTSYAPGALNPGTGYCWQIIAKSGTGSVSSAIWSFTTQFSALAQQYVISTVAGTGIWGYSGDGGPAIRAELGQPEGIAVDAAGNLYIAELLNKRIRRVSPDGIISTVAGTGDWGNSGDGGPATSAELAQPSGTVLDAAGNLYLSDIYDEVIRKVAPDGIISTVAGTGVWGNSGDGGPATSAQLNSPEALAVDAGDDLYIGDTVNESVRKVAADGTITTVAGSGVWGYSGDGGPGSSAQLSEPRGVAVDDTGNLYFADTYNSVIRKLTPAGIISTVAGNGAAGYSGDGGPASSGQLNWPVGVAVDAAHNLYIADFGNSLVREVLPNGTITTVAGNGAPGYSGDGGQATNAQIHSPFGIAVSAAGNIYFSDFDNSAVRVLLPVNPSCSYRVDQTAVAVSVAGGTVQVTIQTGPACWWTLAGLPSWISGKALGSGSAAVNPVVAGNPGALRTATLSIAGTAVAVTQADGVCSYSLGASGGTTLPGGGTGSIAVTADASCPWTASSPADWVTLTGSTSGVGSGTLSYSVAPNTGGVRSSVLTVAGLSFNVQQDGVSAGSQRFVPVTPCRVADTRGGGGSMAAAETRSFAVPQSGCGIPSSAQAYSLNVTVVPQGPLSYLTLWPTGQGQPLVSTLNSFGGIVVANAAIVPAGFNGAVSMYVTDPTDVILDIDGYFDAAGTYAFYPVQPCRVADTRNAAGPFGGPALDGVLSRDFPVPASSCGLPATASAYSMNVTVVPGGYLGYLKTWPTGQAQPNVSTLNSWTGKVVANAALVPAGSGGAISVYAEDATQAVLDTNGYFGIPGGNGALNFYPVTPCRVADTRGDAGPLGGPKMGDGESRSFPIPSSGCGIPATAAAYSLNVTVVPDGMLQYLTVWPAGAGQPLVSTLNSWDGAVVANAAIVPAGAGGAISVFVANRTQVILDINGYFAP